jgi:hypothetical protein
VLADDLANPGHGHEPVPFLCLCDSNTEARVMYEAGVRYVIQSEALTVQPPCLALTRPPCANARTRSRLEPVAALCVHEGPIHHTAHTRHQLTARTHGVFFLCFVLCTQGRAIRGQMHNHTSLEKATFMADYIRLHKEDMEQEQINEKRKQLEPFLAKLGNFKRGT